MKLLELIHDYDHPEAPSNVDLWAERYNAATKRHYAYKDANYPDMGSFDLIIIHGGSQHLWNKEDDPWLAEEIDFIKKALGEGKPVIGFCLGSQIISEARGGRVFHSDEKETGFYHVAPYPEAMKHPILRGFENGFSTFEWHSDHYTLPEEFITLAYTEAAKNQIIASASVPAAGFQFHPEYTKKIIAEYAQCFNDECWRTEKGQAGLEDFIKAVSEREETYELFEKLIKNTIDYFNSRFHVRLEN